MKAKVLNELWEWADKEGNWAKKIVKLVSSETEIGEKDRNDILDCLLYENGLLDNYNSKPLKKPDFTMDKSDNDRIVLTGLSNVKGVNRLADSQVLEFSPNLTVVYGNNGSGKSGYARILKSLGFSYDDINSVLPNAYSAESNVKQSAEIKYKNGEKYSIFNWNNERRSNDLNDIAIYNSNCVDISIDKNRNLIATPEGFNLFYEVSAEINDLRENLVDKITESENKLNWADNLHKGTSSFNFINQLKSSTTKSEIDKICSFTAQDKSQKLKLDKDIENLNVNLLKKEIEKYKSQLAELKQLKLKIKKMKEILNESNIKEYNTNLEYKVELIKKKEINIVERVETLGNKIVDSSEFVEFLKSAEKYIALIDEDYPSKDDSCIYCGQNLNEESQELISTYRKLMNDDTDSKIESLDKQIESYIQKVRSIDTNFQLHHNPFDLKEIFVPQVILDTFNKCKKIYNEIINKETIKNTNFDFDNAIRIVEERHKIIDKELNSKKTILSEFEEEKTKLQNQINELVDKKLLREKISEIKKYVEKLKYSEQIEEIAKNTLKTNAISKLSSKLRKELIEQKFVDLFKEELKKVKCDVDVSLNFGTQKGNPKLKQVIGPSKYSLNEVLSEGEQKSISLAHLLTELRISDKYNPVIFDDPVNSLDHERIGIVAKRLIRLAKSRQVIIFTHSILFFYAIEQNINSNKVDYQYYTVENKLDRSGYLYKNVPAHKETYSTYEKKINELLNVSKAEQQVNGGKIAIDGYGYLRSAIELLVEDEIFKRVVKRYKRNIMFGKLEEVKGKEFDDVKTELNDIYEEVCQYIDAHSNPQELAYSPSINQLKEDFNRVKEIKDIFK